MWSLLGTFKLGGIDTKAYLWKLRQRISDLTFNRIAELLPATIWLMKRTLLESSAAYGPYSD